MKRRRPPVISNGKPQADEAATYEDLFDSQYLEMVRLAWLILGSEALAQEAVQDAFVKLHLRWRGVDNPPAFLRVCVVNRCRDLLRRRRREREAYDGPRSVPRAAASEPEYLLDVLQVLSPERRQIIVLRFYAQMTLRDIAAALGMREGSVHSALSRALAQLREELRE